MSTSPTAVGARRKSGRAVKVPEKFMPDVSSSQIAPAGSKRKRGANEDDGASGSEDEEGEENEESDTPVEDESAGEEELRAARRRAKSKSKAPKKSAAKKPKTNGNAPRGSLSAVKLPSRPKKSKKVAIADRTADGLYADVFTSGRHLEDVAGQFLQDYREAGPAAITALVNMVIRSAGCDIEVTEDDINDIDNVDGKLGELQEEFQAQNITDYPLVLKAKSSKDFKSALTDFFTALILAMDETKLMYDGVVLIENINAWFITMSSSNSRPFRHTATVVNLTITSAMCTLARSQLEKAAKMRQQAKSEQKRGGNKARIAQFQKDIELSDERYEFLLEKIKDLFDSVYVHRYRDVDPKIRLECVFALGDWILTLPDHFSEGAYLRYMGWMLSDTFAPMREAVVGQLDKIMKNRDNHGNMITFIERFRPRIIEIATRDAESSVRSSAVALADVIRQAGMLEPDDIDVIGRLIYDSDILVRSSVVSFFVTGVDEVYDSKIEELGGTEELDVLAADEEDTDSPRREWIKLKSLAEVLSSYDAEDQEELPSQIDKSADVKFLNVSSVETRFTLAAKSLYHHLEELRDWDLLASYLLFDHSAKPSGNKSLRAIKASFKPSDKEEVILLEMLNAVVKLSISKSGETDRGKKGLTKEAVNEAKESAARRLAALIPRLLKKYGAIPHTSIAVLRLEHELNLGVFQDLRQDSTGYAKLLDEISNQFTTHADRGVLNEASSALLHARKFEELEEVTEAKVQSLWEDTINTLRKINKAGIISARGGFREPILRELSHNLARLDNLASISNCVEPLEANLGESGPLPINILLDIIARGVFEEEDLELDALEDEIVLSAIRSSFFYFMWKVRHLSELKESEGPISDIDIDQIKELQDAFTTNLVASLSSRATNDPVRLFATGTFLDLHMLFATLRPLIQKPKSKNGAVSAAEEQDEHLLSTIKEITPEVQAELTSIFDTAEKHFAKKSRRKLAEPGEDEDPEDLDSGPDDDEDEEASDSERQTEILKAEQQLCELTGKLVLAILAKVIDASGPLKGKLTTRIQRNRTRLGPNFKEVVAYLDEPKSKTKRSHKSKAQISADAAKKSAKSKAIVEESDDEEDPFAEEEPDDEELHRREAFEEEPAASIDEEGPAASPEAEDDVMGD